jgi:hypothetical protein
MKSHHEDVIPLAIMGALSSHPVGVRRDGIVLTILNHSGRSHRPECGFCRLSLSVQRAAKRLHCSRRKELPWQWNLIGIWMLSVAVGEKRIRARSRSGTPSEVFRSEGQGPQLAAPSWGHNEFAGTVALMPGVVGSRDDIELKCERFERDRSKHERFACDRSKRRLGQWNPGGGIRSGPRLRLASSAPKPATRPSGGYRDDHGLGHLPWMVLVLSLKHAVAPGVARGRRAAHRR